MSLTHLHGEAEVHRDHPALLGVAVRLVQQLARVNPMAAPRIRSQTCKEKQNRIV